ncbi:MAG: 3-dehydroquinate synthase, partial [Lachnospiraceae bacterium]|nr:3-dehydroquinate synthase [Lachnospiraceae bacterium]
MHIDLSSESIGYDIIHERGILKRAGSVLDLSRKVLILTDDGVPAGYAKTVADQAKEPVIVTIPQGENSKNVENYLMLLRT